MRQQASCSLKGWQEHTLLKNRRWSQRFQARSTMQLPGIRLHNKCKKIKDAIMVLALWSSSRQSHSEIHQNPPSATGGLLHLSSGVRRWKEKVTGKLDRQRVPCVYCRGVLRLCCYNHINYLSSAITKWVFFNFFSGDSYVIFCFVLFFCCFYLNILKLYLVT